MAVGLSASVVSHTVCSRILGEPTNAVDKFINDMGIYGVDSVVGFVASELTEQSINAVENRITIKFKEMKEELKEVEQESAEA